MTAMLDLIRDLPAQLRWAAAFDPPTMPAADAAIVTGMGGSGIAGEAAAVVAAADGRRIAVHKSYGLPGWASDGLIVAVSHSGDTEETLHGVAEAQERGLGLAAVTTGGALADLAGSQGFPVAVIPPGPQPRAAFGFLTGALLRMLEGAGLVSQQESALHEAADVLDEILAGDGPALAEDIATALAGRFSLVYAGTGPASVAATRWKTQINENAKAPAAHVALPEGNHNDIVGWAAHPDLAATVAAVFLQDFQDHPRIVLRAELTRALMEPLVPVARLVGSRGSGTLARLFSLVVIGDLVSVALAARSGTDPMPVDVIQDLKARLAQENR